MREVYAKNARRETKKKQKRQQKRAHLDESESDAMDDFDVPDICLGGGHK
jgi:hypothetical protein